LACQSCTAKWRKVGRDSIILWGMWRVNNVLGSGSDFSFGWKGPNPSLYTY
jgi:hypothetical protein